MLTAAVLCCGAVLGQAHCGTSYTYARSYQYQYPSYNYGYAQTYQQPAYNYNYNYQYQKPYQDVIQFVAVEDPYVSELVGAQKRAEMKAAAKLQPEVDLTAQVTRLADAVARLEQRAAQPYAAPAYPGPAPSPQGFPSPQAAHEPPPLPSKGQPFAAPEPPYVPSAPAKSPPPNALPPLLPTAPPPTPTPEPARPVGMGGGRRLNDRAVQVLNVNCAKCHTGASAKKGFKIFEDGGAVAALDPIDLLSIDQAVYSGAMPPAKPLDEQAYSDLRAGINDFGPDIAALLRQAKTQR